MRTNLEKNVQYCRSELVDDSELLVSFMFFDECRLSLCRQDNKQNCRIKNSERPRKVHEAPHSSPSTKVRYFRSQNEFTGPYVFKNQNVTEKSRKRMRSYYVVLRLRSYPEDMIFRQDGAPSHYAVMIG